MKNLNFRMFVNNAKILFVTVVTTFTMGACKTYTNTVVAVYDNEKILVKNKAEKNAQDIYRLIDWSEGKEEVKETIPFLLPGDPVTMQKKASLDPKVSMKPYDYEHTRVFDANNTKIGLPEEILKQRMQDSLRNKIINESTRTMPVVIDTVKKR